MNLHQFLSVLVQEECNEVGQRASKLTRFGFDEVQPGQPLNNLQRLEDEIDDLLLRRALLQIATDENKRGIVIQDKHWIEKGKKILRFAKLSMTQGQISRSVYRQVVDMFPPEAHPTK
tara:strand:+ start:2912 stop:3265 length:354 start_codon:yes stop_codon:yes gene_type:complete